MYKVCKDEKSSKVVLFNTETSCTIALGVARHEIYAILGEEGHVFVGTTSETGVSPTVHNIRERWEIPIEKSTADKLAKLAMPIHKPIRTKTKAKTEPKEEPVVTEESQEESEALWSILTEGMTTEELVNTKEEPTITDTEEEEDVDGLDVLFGLADYK